MNWFQFILYITGVYTLYYLVVVLADLNGFVRSKAGAVLSRELTFEEPVIAQQALPQSFQGEGSPATITAHPKIAAAPESVGNGGVPYRDVFALARAEAIQYTGKVAF